MTKEIHPSQGSGVLETIDERDSGVVSAPLIDPQFLKEKESGYTRRYSSGDIYLAASYVSLLVELLAYGYTLWCTSHPQGDLTLFKVSMLVFALYLLFSAVFMTNSIVELRDLINRRGRKLTQTEKNIKCAAEWCSVAASTLYLLLFSFAIVMACNIHNTLLQYSSLVLTVVAPIMSSTGGFLRASDTYLSYRKEKDALQASGEQAVTQKAAIDRRAKSYFVRASLYSVVATIRFLGFIACVWQAFILVGNTHRLFHVTERAFLVSKVTLAAALLVLVVVERVLKRTTEPNLAEQLQLQVVPLTEQQHLVSTDACTSDVTTQPPSNEWKVTTVIPCGEEAMAIA